MSIHIHHLLASLFVLVGACSEAGDEPTDGSTTTESSGATPEASTADAHDTTSGDMPTGDPATAAPTTGDATAAPTTGDDSGEPTTDGPAAPPAACAAYCDKQVECDLFASHDECLDFCSDEYTRSFAPCEEATATYLGCMASQTCDDLLFADPETGACPAERAPMYDLCNDEYEYCGVSSSSGGGECDLAIECDAPPLLEMKCDDTTCTCYSAGAQIGSCPAEAICDDHDALLEKAEPCCGF